MSITLRTYKTTQAEGFTFRAPQMSSEGQIKTEAKVYQNPWISIYSDTSRCADCGAAGCFEGTEADVSIGCPFEHRIPDVHKNFQEALHVLEKYNIFEMLKKLDPHTAQKIDPATNPDDPDFVRKIVRHPIEAFAALKTKASRLIEQAEAEFNHYMLEAYKVSEDKGPMHDLFGRICPASLCKDPCSISTSRNEAVEIPKNMTVVADYAWEAGFVKPPHPKQGERDKNILLIGSGFASLTAAYKLRQLGYGVTIVEKNAAPAEPGNNQILGYKSVHERFNRHVENLKSGGVNFVTGIAAGQGEHSLENLKNRYNASAILIGTGVGQSKEAPLSGDAVKNTITWDQLTGAQQEHDRDGTSISEDLNAKGKRVLISGTSDTAVDAGMTAALQGATEVVFLSRRDALGVKDHSAYKNMRAVMDKNGVKFTVEKWVDAKFLDHHEGRMRLSGKHKQSGEDIAIDGDMFIHAIGNETGDLKKQFGRESLRTHEDGRFNPIPVLSEKKLIDPSKPDVEENTLYEAIATKTDMMGVGAGLVDLMQDGTPILAMGDNVRRGGSLAATAGRDGLDAARWVHEEFNRKDGVQAFAEFKPNFA
ncbi:MAG: FAD-dependent oxidoreductase [Pseudomonadota bacterium]